MTNGKSAASLASAIVVVWAVAGSRSEQPRRERAGHAAEHREAKRGPQPKSELEAKPEPERAASKEPAAAVSPAGELEAGDLLAALAAARGDSQPEPPRRDVEPSLAPPPSIVVPETPRLAELEKAFAAAAPDRARDDEVRAHLDQAAAQAGIEAEVVEDSECRGEICRVRLSFEGPSDAIRFQNFARSAEFGYEAVPAAINGPVLRAGPDQAPVPWKVELLLSPADAKPAEE